MASKQITTGDMTVAEVAKGLGSTHVNVLLLIKRGLLEAREVDGEWFIDKDDFANFLESEAGRAGRAPCRSACSKAGGCDSCE